MLAKGSAEFDGNQKDKERHSIVVTVNMPNLQLMDLIAAYNGNTETASRRQYARTLPWCAAAWLRSAPAGSCRGPPRGYPARPVGPVCAIDSGTGRRGRQSTQTQQQEGTSQPQHSAQKLGPAPLQQR